MDLDPALSRFQMVDLEYGEGVANAGTVAASSLLALGHPALLEGFLDVYAPRLRPLPPGSAIPEAERPAALGSFERRADWVASFEEALSHGSWRQVLGEAVTWLLPGLKGGDAFPWVRTANAIRCLEDHETGTRLRELAFGLGYWAARYSSPPDASVARDSDATGTRDGALAEATDPSRLCAEAAARYLEAPESAGVAMRAVVAVSALEVAAPAFEADLRERVVAEVLRVARSLRSVALAGSAVRRGEADPVERSRLASRLDELRYRAACSIQEDAIVFAEACLREHQKSPDPVFLEAAADAVLRLDSGRY